MNIFYYPSTSADCQKSEPIFIKGDKPTSLGTPYTNRNDPIGYHVKETVEPSQIEPKIRIEINPVNRKEPKNYTKCSINQCYTDVNDPRLYDVMRSQSFKLDKPPVTSSKPLSFDEMYKSDLLKGYGKNYTTYDTINAGQIRYWWWDTPGAALQKPIFSTSANVKSSVYIDPMDNIKPMYKREPILRRNIMEPNNIGCLSFINDTTELREELMGSLIAKNEQTRYSSRWL